MQSSGSTTESNRCILQHRLIVTTADVCRPALHAQHVPHQSQDAGSSSAASLNSTPSLLSQHPTHLTVHKIPIVLLCAHNQAGAHKRFLLFTDPAPGRMVLLATGPWQSTTMIDAQRVHSASALQCKAHHSCSCCTRTPLYRCCATEYIAVHGMAQHKLLDPSRVYIGHNHSHAACCL